MTPSREMMRTKRRCPSTPPMASGICRSPALRRISPGSRTLSRTKASALPRAIWRWPSTARRRNRERAVLQKRFVSYDIAPERILLEGPAPHTEFLKAYDRVDIALDTFPYNGGTTTMEAIWQGVPVLTFYGDRWASRQSCSLLKAAGLDDWCAPDLQTYIDRAVRLACSPATPAELASLRSMMRERLGASDVCDSARLCRALEEIYVAASRNQDPM